MEAEGLEIVTITIVMVTVVTPMVTVIITILITIIIEMDIVIEEVFRTMDLKIEKDLLVVVETVVLLLKDQELLDVYIAVFKIIGRYL